MMGNIAWVDFLWRKRHNLKIFFSKQVDKRLSTNVYDFQKFQNTNFAYNVE